jgi:DNA primase large subunit
MGKKVAKIDYEEVMKYYSRKEVAEAICEAATKREIGVLMKGGRFGKRPDILQFPQDVIEMAKQGVVTFNVSEERWQNPLDLEPGMKALDLDNNRIGWDLILDIDCKQIEFSKITAQIIIEALKYYNVPLGVKFSGGSGFHIGISWESIPKVINQKDSSILFPDVPRAVAEYIVSMVGEPLSKRLLEKFDMDHIQKRTGKTFDELVKNRKLDPWQIVGIDSVLISNRHLIRSVYSLNEKTGLVSVPLLLEEVEEFDLKSAKMKNVNVENDVSKGRIFLSSKESSEGLKSLFTQAIDYVKKQKIDVERKEEKDYQPLPDAAPEETFPPCILHILSGIKDGRKRATFILVNFFRSAGWSYDMIEDRLKKWNDNLEEPLHEQELFASFRYNKTKGKQVLPPNCDNAGYYLDFGVCNPDGLCKKIKNPISYVKVKVKSLQEKKKEEEIQKQKEERRKARMEKDKAKTEKKMVEDSKDTPPKEHP